MTPVAPQRLAENPADRASSQFKPAVTRALIGILRAHVKLVKNEIKVGLKLKASPVPISKERQVCCHLLLYDDGGVAVCWARSPLTPASQPEESPAGAPAVAPPPTRTRGGLRCADEGHGWAEQLRREETWLEERGHLYPPHPTMPASRNVLAGEGERKHLTNNTEAMPSRDTSKTNVLWPSPGELSSGHSQQTLSHGTVR